jgi:outer membrane protein assembly factor BamA
MFGKWGYKVNNVQKTGRRPVLFRLDYFFSPESYQAGSEENLVGIYTNPLKVETDLSLGSAMVKSPPATEEKRSPADQPIASQAMKEGVKQGTWSIYPNFILDPVNIGYGGGLGYSNADMFKAGVGFDISTMITTRNYYDLSISFSKLQFIPWVDTLEISAALNQFPSQSFYGIGNESELENAAIYWWTRNEASIKVEKRFLDHYGANLSLFYRDTTIESGQQPLEGTQVGQPSFEKHYGFWDELEDSERWGGPLFGRDGGMTNGLTLSLFRDMRDDWQVPHRGDFEAISVTRVGPELGSDYDYTKLSIDLRKYFEPSWLQDLPMDHWFSSDRTLWTKFFGPQKHRSFAFWVGATHTFSDEFDYYHQTVKEVPFYELTTVGGGSNNRGFYGSRFRDNDAFSMSAEYRWQYWRWFDAVVFVDSGMVMPDMFEGDNWNGVWHTSYGAGFRAHVPPGVNIVFDFSFSPEVPGGMLTQGWVF